MDALIYIGALAVISVTLFAFAHWVADWRTWVEGEESEVLPVQASQVRRSSTKEAA